MKTFNGTWKPGVQFFISYTLFNRQLKIGIKNTVHQNQSLIGEQERPLAEKFLKDMHDAKEAKKLQHFKVVVNGTTEPPTQGVEQVEMQARDYVLHDSAVLFGKVKQAW